MLRPYPQMSCSRCPPLSTLNQWRRCASLDGRRHRAYGGTLGIGDVTMATMSLPQSGT